MSYQCRVAPSLGELEGHPNDVWGTTPYVSRDEPTVFFGLYDLRDYIALFRHRGKKWILWAGSDLRNLRAGFMLNDGKLRMISKALRKMPRYYEQWSKRMAALLHEAEHYVENEFEAEELGKLDIECRVVPSFMGDIDDYKLEYKQNALHPSVYVSCGKNREEEYGFNTVEKIAFMCPEINFHLFGGVLGLKGEYIAKNIYVHGRVPKEKMNELIKGMQCGLRLNEYDGASEVTMKSILWGQHPITRLRFPHIPSFRNDSELISLLNGLKDKKEPNLKGREFYRKWLNRYPWNAKNN